MAFIIYDECTYRTNFYSIMSKLHVDSVTKSFDLKAVLTDIFISVEKGEIIGLLGRNGSGKSTLLKIIFGSLDADNKFVRVDNKIIQSLTDRRNIINYLPQNNFLPNNLKVKSIISTFCTKEYAEIISKKTTIKDILNKNNYELSGGEKRVLEIYLIIYSNAKFILLDEPFNGVSPILKEDIKKVIIEQSKNKGIIVTDHDYRNILDISTRLVMIFDGGTKEIKDKEELMKFGYLPE